MIYLKNTTAPQEVWIPRQDTNIEAVPKDCYTEGYDDGYNSGYEDGMKEGIPLQEKSVTIVEDITEVLPDGGFSAMTKVTADATQYAQGKYDAGYAAGKAEFKLQDKVYEVAGDTGNVTPDDDYDGLSSVEVDAVMYGKAKYNEGVASVRLQSKSVEVVANGEQTVSPDSGYSGMSAVTLNVNVPTGSPCNLQAKEVTYDANDTYQIVPDEDYDGLSAVTVTVNVPQTGGTGNAVLSNLNAITNGVYYPIDYPRNYLHFLDNSYFNDTLDNDFGLNITFRISSGATGYLIKSQQSSYTADISLDGASSSISIDFSGWTATIPVTLDEWHTLTLSPYNNILKIDGNDVQASGSQSGGQMYFCNWCYQAIFTDIYEFNKWNHYSSDTAPYDRNWIAKERNGQPCFYDVINNEYKTFRGSNPEYETEAIDGWSSVTVNVMSTYATEMPTEMTAEVKTETDYSAMEAKDNNTIYLINDGAGITKVYQGTRLLYNG